MVQNIFTAAPIELGYWAGLLTEAECQELIAIGRQHLKEASVIDETNGAETADTRRRSDMAWPAKETYPLIRKIAQGIASFTGIPESHQEPLQVLRYLPGGEYRPHFDSFAAGAPTLQEGGNRQKTMIIYLNAVAEGGETSFPELGITVRPVPGCGILFNNLDASEQRLQLSLHAGNPVVQGEKWIATCWIRQRPYVRA
jgi:prolyl 4-hydroxylase